MARLCTSPRSSVIDHRRFSNPVAYFRLADLVNVNSILQLGKVDEYLTYARLTETAFMISTLD